MSFSRYAFGMRFLPLVALLSACAGSTLGQDDSNAVMGQLVTMTVVATSAAAPHAETTPPLVVSIDRTVTCPNGGAAEISGDLSGDIDATTGTGSYTVDLMTTFSECALGNGLVINGAPYLSTSGVLSFQGFGLTGANMSYSGAVTANGDTCHVDLAMAGLGPTAVSTARGTICGNAVRAFRH